MSPRLGLFLRYSLSVLVPVFVLVVVGVFSVFFTRRATYEELERLHEGILLQVEQSVETLIEEANATGVAIGSSADLLVRLREALTMRQWAFEGFQTLRIIQSLINPSVYARPALHSVYVFFEDFADAILTSEFDVVPLEEMPDTGWYTTYRAMAADESFYVERRIFTPLINTDTGSEVVLTIYRRIFALSRPSIQGVVVLNVSISELESLIDSRRTHPGQVLTVHSPEGFLLFGSEPQNPGEYQVSHRVSDSRWQYTLYTPRHVFLRPAETVFRVSAGIIALASGVGIGIALLLARRHLGYIQSVLRMLDSEGAEESGDAKRELADADERSRRGFGYVTYRVLRTLMEKKQLEAEVSTRALREKALELLFLRSQMNPHFLFNTLEVINWKSLDHTGGPTEINEMITQLSEILKYSLRGPSRFVVFQDELHNSENYLTLQRQRYGDRLRAVWRIDDDTRSASVIPMMLQPLIENSIYHGIRDSGGDGVITVGAWREGNRLVVEVTDTGPGMKEAALDELHGRLAQAERASSDHVGLVNTHRRIVLAFGVSASITVANRPEGGFAVTITLPFQPFVESRDLRYSEGV